MIRIGAHMPTSYGFDKVPQLTVDSGGNTFQIFPHSPRMWKASLPSKKAADEFQVQMKKYEIPFEAAFCHCGYLINPASPKDDIWQKSVELLIIEGKICQSLGIPYLNIHPGSHTGAGEKEGIDRIVKAIDEFLKTVPDIVLLLENVSPKGGNIGYKMEQLAKIIELVAQPERIGVTYDTCHGFDAGYDITNKESVEKLFDEMESFLGLWRVKMIHLNDSKAPLGKPLDRHENIGKGFIGDRGFRNFLSFPQIQNIPWILETPNEEDLYTKEIAHVKSLIGLINVDR
ncbi:deoxyribonuclease IV [Thermotoga profunda]|uniref:deoxyribonuclease IV n=1 Tax=Thermotoga profunda TaxID=1508420 RepID=UPI0005971040|nr:deoxyribonuclease IV [Thermotoga profunda]